MQWTLVPAARAAVAWPAESFLSEWESAVKKGRHRRFEEARALKRGPDIDIEGILNEGVPAEIDDDEDDYEEYEPGSWTNPEAD